uniref:Uncharacterized protein n=1 Tax=Paramormyrops kingsleyae TaxID=1676925 RepID=A0A3B3RKN6_9TELE
DSAMSALSSASSSSCCSLRNLARLALASSSPGFHFLDLLLPSFHSDLLGLIQTVLQVLNGLLHIFLHALQVSTGILLAQLYLHFIEISLHLLFDSQGLVTTSRFRFKGCLQGLHHALIVSFSLFHLLILFREFTFNFCFYLVELQLGTKDLTLFML